MWKSIKGYEGYYSVSDQGQIKNDKTQQIITGDINNAGYYRVTLYYQGKKRYFKHRLVAEHFIPNPNNYKEVNHINGNKADNNVANLEWVTRTMNERESRRTGIKSYKPFQVIYADGTIQQFEFKSELAFLLGVTTGCIRGYLHHVSQGYTKYNISKIEYIKA